MDRRLVAVLAVLFWASTCVVADARIEIAPERPMSSDIVRIAANGVLPVPCYDVVSTVTVVGRVILVEVEARGRGGLCIQVLSFWSVAHEVGPLAAGPYQVVVDFVRIDGRRATTYSEEARFVVGDAAKRRWRSLRRHPSAPGTRVFRSRPQ